ncbi:MAG: hypothetical protein ACE5FR_01945 [Rhodospirillales bacterium]
MNRIVAVCILIGAVFPAAADEVQEVKNDYPTAARAEFVLGCMGANGQTPEMLRKCSCSIDFIASIIPYEKYVRMETVLRLQQLSGDRGGLYRSTPWAKALIEELGTTQAEATLKCF